jgi:hypothetical protein
MDYKDPVKDFVNRTKVNLKLVRQAVNDGKEAYEVTQLINSLHGLLVLPQQEFYNKIPETPLSELEKSGEPMPRVQGGYPQVRDLRQLARYLRNGVAHFNLRFTASGGHIDGFIICNEK